jgi:hypothetical protein
MRQCQEWKAETDMRVRLQLDDFGKEALEAQTRDGSSRDAVLGAAARYYLADRDSGRVAWRVPRFARRDDPEVGETDVDIDEDTMKALEEEARRQGIAPGRLVEHAFLYFVADLDSGRAMRGFANME